MGIVQKLFMHRDVKPDNILLRKEDGTWQVKLIDFGLAVEQAAAPGSSTARGMLTPQSGEQVGTFEYAAPEQMGKLPGVRVGVPADIYGFAKTCCYALFQTANPRTRHWQEKKVPAPLQQLLERCLEESPQQRPRNFATVVEQLHEALIPMEVLPVVLDGSELEIIEEVQTTPPPLPVRPVGGPVSLTFTTGTTEAGWLQSRLARAMQGDKRIKLYLDRQFIGDGVVSAMFTIRAETAVGRHLLEVASMEYGVFGLKEVRKAFDLRFPGRGAYEVGLDYLEKGVARSTADVLGMAAAAPPPWRCRRGYCPQRHRQPPG